MVSSPTTDNQSDSSSSLNILLIDGDSTDLLAISQVLNDAKLNNNCVWAGDIESALEFTRSIPLDLIFLGYFSLKKNTFSLLKTLLQHGVMVPIIVFTDQNNGEAAVDLMRAGAADYLHQAEVTPESLRRRVSSAVRLYRAEQLARQTSRALVETSELLQRRNQELECQRQQIEVQNLQLIKAARLKSEFIATISHELRTPMNSIVGFSQVLMRQFHGPLNRYQSKMMRRLSANAEHLMLLIDDLLDFSKADSGQLILELQSFDLSELAKTIVREIRPQAAAKCLELHWHSQMKNPQVLGDRDRIGQIITNLLSNGIKFTSQGSVQLRLSEQPGETDPGQIVIQVSDSGIGIDPKAQTVIFDAFRQLNQSDRRQQAGTGLGLAITRNLVVLMGGSIHLNSIPGKGSCFTILLPRKTQRSPA